MEPSNWSAQIVDSIMNSNRARASSILDQALREGVTPLDFIESALDPALVELGNLWNFQSISLAQAYVGAKIAEDVLLRCLPQGELSRQIPGKGAVVIGNVEDDFHSLGRRMIGSFLKANGWIVHDLGNDVPPEEFVETALKVGASVIGASAMMHTTALNILKIRDLIDKKGLSSRLKLAVGGAVFNWRPELVLEVGGDGTASNAASVDGLFQKLQKATQGEGP